MAAQHDNSKRRFLKTTAYMVPVILTLKVSSSLAHKGSWEKCNNGVGNGPDCLPPGIDKNGKFFLDNDDHGGTPGEPQNKGGFDDFNFFGTAKHHHKH